MADRHGWKPQTGVNGTLKSSTGPSHDPGIITMKMKTYYSCTVVINPVLKDPQSRFSVLPGRRLLLPELMTPTAIEFRTDPLCHQPIHKSPALCIYSL